MSFLTLKPIAILEYDLDNAPAYFAEYLRGEKIPFEHIRIDAGEAVPASIDAFSGLCLMGARQALTTICRGSQKCLRSRAQRLPRTFP